MNQAAIEGGRAHGWLLVAAGLGVAWTAFGIVHLAVFVTPTHESLMMRG